MSLGGKLETKQVLLSTRYSILTVNAVDHVGGPDPRAPFTESRSNVMSTQYGTLIKSAPVSRAGRAANGVAHILTA